MAGHGSGEQYNFTGIKKYFNSYTLIGRKNCVLATFGGVATLVLFFALKPKKQAAVANK